jgi:hypothetical protein
MKITNGQISEAVLQQKISLKNFKIISPMFGGLIYQLYLCRPSSKKRLVLEII